MKGEVRLLCCGQAEGGYALDMRWVRTIQRADRVRRSPGADGCIGVWPDRQGDLPVYGLVELLQGQSSADSTNQHVVVIEGPAPWGLLVEGRIGIKNALRADLLPVPPSLRRLAFLESFCRQGEEIAPVLSPGGLRADLPSENHGAPQDSGEPGTPLPATWPGGQSGMVLLPLRAGINGQRSLVAGFSVSQFLEFLPPGKIFPIPMAPQNVRGVTLWRDRVIMVIDLPRSLGLPDSVMASAARLSVVRDGSGELVGLLTASTARLLNLPVPHVASTRSLAVNREMLRACIETERETILVPKLRNLLGSPRQSCIGGKSA